MLGSGRSTSAFVAFACALVVGRAEAAGPLGPPGAPIRTSDYAVDLFQGPVLASSRVTGLGGAFTAIAEGAEGIPFNPAAASLRMPYSTTRDDWDVTGGLTLPSSVRDTDFDNDGRRGFAFREFVFLTGGGLVQHGRLGLGAVVSTQLYELGRPDGEAFVGEGETREEVRATRVRLFKVDAVGAYALLGEQLHVGAGVRAALFYHVGDAVSWPASQAARPPGDAAAQERLLFNTNGIGLQGGVLWAPRALPLRVGAALRSPVLGTVDPGRARVDDAGDRVVGGFYLPARVSLPWELEWGVAVQLGRRPLNLPWTDKDALVGPEVEAERRVVAGKREPAYRAARRILKARYRALPRQKVLLTTSALVSGAVADAVGVESMLRGVVDRSGERVTLTLRGGVEAEVIPNRLQLRGGSYMEPSRFRGGSPRLHGTAGFEVRLLEWSVFGLFDEGTSFRLTAAGDVARDYFGWSVGLGFWH